ncbi:leucine-rich repeat-containing protein 40-like [Mytilus californianus]|uniref:leucine-rich repeat-containing protein 40-like n=1 Tax=Mytilus californianus TaxID=6549 RepID=UPI002247DF5F|nr:leucine-rich repeat-containing protein 40-like [Mytilus californianus]
MTSDDTLQSLRLRGNQLIPLPLTLTLLSKLSDLQVQYNPMKDLDTNILMNVSSNLKKLSFGSINMTKWPTSVMGLNKLVELSVYNVSMDSFPVNAFEGLEDSLMFLQIESTNISRLPVSINKLSKVGDFSNLALLITLELSFYPISMVELEAFATTQSLQVLHLRYTKLRTVPEAIKKIRLYSIDLTGSNVICTCVGFGWMKQWPTRKSTFISGKCTNLNIPIYEFQMKYIPKC